MAREAVIHSRDDPHGGCAFDRDAFLSEIAQARMLVHQSLANTEQQAGVEGNFPRGYVEKLAVLRALLSMRDSLIVPELDPRAPRGHSYPILDEERSLMDEDRVLLEELADLGLLKRELHNLINLCPHCQHCQINFRELCPQCGAIECEIESLVHHFSCAYSGLESEFTSGMDLVCPKCRKVLHQLGQDFERPHDTYICRVCSNLFEEPMVNGQCLNCSREFAGGDVEVARIYQYRPTLLTVRAVELNRLTGLDVSEIMYDAHVRLATREFLKIEAEREIYRVNRYGGALSAAKLVFEHHGRYYPIFRDWKPEMLRQLGALLHASHRTLDILARINNSCIGFLYPETDKDGLKAIRSRIMNHLEQMAPVSRSGRELTPRWMEASWIGENAGLKQVLAFFEFEEESP